MCNIEKKLQQIEDVYGEEIPSTLFFTFYKPLLLSVDRNMIIEMFYGGKDPGQEHIITSASKRLPGDFFLRLSNATALHVSVLFSNGFVGHLYQAGHSDEWSIIQGIEQPLVINFKPEPKELCL